MEEELRGLLLADAGVQALAGTRVNFGVHPQGLAWPGVVMNTVSEVPDYVLSGESGTTDARVQVDCYGETYGAAKRLGRAVRAALSGYAGGGLQAVMMAGSRDTRASTEGDRLKEPFRVSMDFRVIYTNA